MNQPTAPDVVGTPQAGSAGASPSAAGMPNPARLFQTFFAYQQSAAMKAAIDLDVFTAIADRQSTAEQIAARAGAAERARLKCGAIEPATAAGATEPIADDGIADGIAEVGADAPSASAGTTA